MSQKTIGIVILLSLIFLFGCEPNPYPRDEIADNFSYLKSIGEKRDGLPYWPKLTKRELARRGMNYNPDALRTFEYDKQYLAEKKKDLDSITDKGVTFEEVLNFALKYSNTIIDASADYELAKRNYLWSKYKYLPKPKIIAGMTSDADITKYYQKVDAAIKETFKYGTELSLGLSIMGNQYFRTDDANEYETTAGLTITQPLLRGRYNLNFYDDWKKYRDAMRALIVKREELILSVVERFYEMVRLQNSLKIAQDSYERNMTLLEKYEARLKMGKVAEADVESIRIQLKRASNSVRSVKDSLEERRRDFNYYVGMPKPLRSELIEPELKYEPMKLDMAKIYEVALKMRVDYLAFRDQIDDLMDERRKVQNDLLPEFNLFFGYNYRGVDRDFGDAVRHLGKPEWEVGFTFAYDFDRRILRIALSEVSERTRRAWRDFVNKKENINEEIEDFAREAERLRRDVEVAKKSLDLKSRELKRDLDLFEKGKISNDEVVRKEDEYNNERDSYIRLLTKHELMKYRYLKIRGTLGR